MREVRAPWYGVAHAWPGAVGAVAVRGQVRGPARGEAAVKERWQLRGLGTPGRPSPGLASLRFASPRRVPGRRLGPERRLARPACAGASPDAGPAARAPRPGGQSSGAPRRPGPASGRSARNAVGWGQLSPLRREGGPGASGLAPGASRRCAAEHLPAGRGGCLARGWAGGIPRLRLERAVLLVCLFSVAVSLLPLCFFP